MGLTIKGLDGLIVKVGKIAADAEKETKIALETFADAVVKQAKTNAPANEGTLRNSIHSEVTGLTAKITVASKYAAYLEFGTRKFAAKYVATLPADWKAYAATFKGKGGGSMDEFIQDIMEWVRQKGIGGLKTKSGNTSTSKDSLDAMQQAAYAIALNILQNGIRPQPYLYPAVKDNTPKLQASIKKIFDA